MIFIRQTLHDNVSHTSGYPKYQKWWNYCTTKVCDNFKCWSSAIIATPQVVPLLWRNHSNIQIYGIVQLWIILDRNIFLDLVLPSGLISIAMHLVAFCWGNNSKAWLIIVSCCIQTNLCSLYCCRFLPRFCVWLHYLMLHVTMMNCWNSVKIFDYYSRKILVEERVICDFVFPLLLCSHYFLSILTNFTTWIFRYSLFAVIWPMALSTGSCTGISNKVL